MIGGKKTPSPQVSVKPRHCWQNPGQFFLAPTENLADSQTIRKLAVSLFLKTVAAFDLVWTVEPPFGSRRLPIVVSDV